jgi:membrane protein DedA with SNARE-associated domain
VPFARFVLLATLGSIPWIAGLAIVGRAVGSNWESWRRHLEYVDYAALAVVVLAIAYLIVRRARSRSDKPTPDAVA